MNFIKKHPKTVIILSILIVLLAIIIHSYINWYSEKGYIISRSPDRQYSVRMLEFPIWGIISDEGLIRVYDDRTHKKLSEYFFDKDLMKSIGVTWYTNEVDINSIIVHVPPTKLPNPVKGVKSVEETINELRAIAQGKHSKVIYSSPVVEDKTEEQIIYTH